MNIVIIGAQWGDEGKGKIVDYLSDTSEVIVRFSGGANAGHTIVFGSEQFALHLVPSGVLYPNTTVILGTGMVIDPDALFDELDMLEKRGINWKGRVFISDRAHLVLPRYRALDKEMEAARNKPIGTTGRGIGVAYSMKSSRDGIRLADIDDPERLVNLSPEDLAYLEKNKARLLPFKINLVDYISKHKNSKILYEGAQGALLDIDTGTYPFVSSGMSSSAGAAAQGGMGPRAIDGILGVFKAYSTRVGNGPFPTEFNQNDEDALCHFVRDTGREYGVTTGRARRCGYLDLVALKYACNANSIDKLVLTHLDVYDTLEDFKACVAYKINGIETTVFPSSIKDLENAEPVFKTFPGWKTSLKKVQNYEDLPVNAKSYIDFIEAYTETGISIVSVGYERSETIVRKNPWIKS